MSVDFFLYSTADPPPRSALAKALQERGWISDLAPDDRPLDDCTVSATKGPVTASCDLAVTHPFAPDEEFGEDWEDERPSKIAREIRKAKTMFTVTGRADGAAFQAEVWNALADVAHGLMEDPQADEYVRVGPGGRKPLGDDLPSPSPALHAYFKALKRAGFRIDRKDPHGFRTWMTVEDLTREGMEALLNATEAHFAADPSAARSMVRNVLAQYAAHGRPAEWFETLRQNFASP